MWSSRDLALVILLAVISFIYSLFVGQLGNLLTGIMGLDFLFMFGHAIFISSGLLLYEGRRWRYFLQGFLVALLYIPTFAAGTPFDVLARIPLIITSFFADLVLNSVYGFFEKSSKLVWWALLCATFVILLTPLSITVNFYFFYPWEMMVSFVNVVALLLPVIIIESIAGGYIGYKIYQRVKNLAFIGTDFD
jgi:hypothetical protein